MKKKALNKIQLLIIILIPIVIFTTLGIAKFNNINSNLNNEDISQSQNKNDIPTNPLDEDKSSNISINEKHDFKGVPLQKDHKGVPILCYHSIANDSSTNDSITMSKDKFRQHMKTIKDLNYTTLTMEQLNDYISSNIDLPEKSVVITFDDGYLNNYINAFPILKEFDMNATIFIISDYSVSKIYNADYYMSPHHIKELSDYGIDIQSHTVTHRELGKLSYEEQLQEFTDSKSALENLTGKPVFSLAYPLGSFNEDTFKAAKEAGYNMGFTIDRGYAEREDNPYELNRICIDYTYGPKDIKNLLTNLKK